MGPIAIFVLILFTLISTIILLSAAFSPVARKIGFRNVRRRIGNTAMVVIGSMVGAALISGSLVLSDSLDKTFENLVDKYVGEMDVMISTKQERIFPEGIAYMDQKDYASIEQKLDIDEVDGLLPAMYFSSAPQKLDENNNPVLNLYMVDFFAVDFDQFNKFGQNPKVAQTPTKPNGVYINESLAKKLEIKEGSKIRIPLQGKQLDYEVEKIYKDGFFPGDYSIVVDINKFNQSIGLPTVAYNYVLVSAKGGIRPENYDGKEFEEKLDDQLKDFDTTNVSLSLFETKQAALDGYGMKAFSDFFLVMSFFGIFAGVLLIINLYSMLASERKYEMGILRAIALKRGQLMKTFVYEGFLYSIASSLLGTFIGLGIGYMLVYSLDKTFNKIFGLIGKEGLFRITFDVNMDSLVLAFAVGSLITILTSTFASYKISRLNIVSAIRNMEEEKRKKINLRWLFTTIVLFMLTAAGFLSLFAFFTARDSMEKDREQENSQFASLTDKKFEETVNVIQSYALYFGVIFILFFGTALFNRLVNAIFKKDISRITVTLSSLAAIVFTALLSKFDSFIEAGQASASIGLFFISGLVLVVGLAIMITYNLNIVVWLTSLLFKPFKNMSSVVKIAFRYPAADRTKTGLTLVMFALVIFLIVYISMIKVTIRQMNEKAIKEGLGGYHVIVMPSPANSTDELTKMENSAKQSNSVSKVTAALSTAAIMPEYKYGDLEDAVYYGDPTMFEYKDEDYYVTSLEGYPSDFLKEKKLKLQDREEMYKTDEEAWQAVIDDPSKVIAGASFVQEGFGKHPNIKVGQKVKVADYFNQKVYEKEIVGIIEASDSTGMSMTFVSGFGTTTEHIRDEFPEQYVSQFSSTQMLVAFDNENNVDDKAKDLKKSLISYNIMNISEISELTQTAQSFMDSLILMFQAFLGFSLIVGASGVAIILARSVQERKQQIGMLRSLGFQRSMILTSFFLEATFITFLGILIGISMGTIGALNEFYISFSDQEDAKPVFAYKEVFIIAAMVYLASIAFSIWPSVKAAKLSPVEATNYPE